MAVLDLASVPAIELGGGWAAAAAWTRVFPAIGEGVVACVAGASDEVVVERVDEAVVGLREGR